MRAILIDPFREKIESIEIGTDYREISKAIGCDIFTVVGGFHKNNDVFVDDEGLLNDPEFFFKLDNYPQPIAGRGLILSHDNEGESHSTDMTVEEVEKRISFLHLRVDGFKQSEGKTEIDGKEFFCIKTEPIFSRRD